VPLAGRPHLVNRNGPNRLPLSRCARRRFTPHRAAKRAGLWVGVPPGFVWVTVMDLYEDVRHFHQREAARLRRLIENATTPALKARLLQEAKQHEWLAKPPGHRREDQGAHSEEELAEP